MSEPAVAISPPICAPDAVLTPEEAAALLRVSTKTLAKLPIRRTQVGRRTVRYRGAWILEYLERQAL